MRQAPSLGELAQGVRTPRAVWLGRCLGPTPNLSLLQMAPCAGTAHTFPTLPQPSHRDVDRLSPVRSPAGLAHARHTRDTSVYPEGRGQDVLCYHLSPQGHVFLSTV